MANISNLEISHKSPLLLQLRIFDPVQLYEYCTLVLVLINLTVKCHFFNDI